MKNLRVIPKFFVKTLGKYKGEILIFEKFGGLNIVPPLIIRNHLRNQG